jgi:hypothetical protein
LGRVLLAQKGYRVILKHHFYNYYDNDNYNERSRQRIFDLCGITPTNNLVNYHR